MRLRALQGVSLLGTALGAGLLAHAADRLPTYWSLSFDGEKPTCRAIVSKANDLETYFETLHKATCSTVDKGDHRVFECGGHRELIAFSREACLARGDALQTDNQKRTLAAFNVCMDPAKGSFALDDAVLYCTCMARNVLRYSDEQLAKMTRVENEKLAKQCLRVSGAEWAASQPRKREAVEQAEPASGGQTQTATPADHGTCFAVSRDGLVVTALHVIKGAPSIAVRFVGGGWVPATLETADEKNDLAILRAQARPRSILSLVSARQVAPGQGVFTVGFPAPRADAETAEYAEGAIRAASEAGQASLLQISTPVQPGNAGGPLVTEAGDVVGIVDFGRTASADASYAIKSDFALDMLPPMPRQETAKNRQTAIQRAVSSVCTVRTAP